MGETGRISEQNGNRNAEWGAKTERVTGSEATAVAGIRGSAKAAQAAARQPETRKEAALQTAVRKAAAGEAEQAFRPPRCPWTSWVPYTFP